MAVTLGCGQHKAHAELLCFSGRCGLNKGHAEAVSKSGAGSEGKAKQRENGDGIFMFHTDRSHGSARLFNTHIREQRPGSCSPLTGHSGQREAMAAEDAPGRCRLRGARPTTPERCACPPACGRPSSNADMGFRCSRSMSSRARTRADWPILSGAFAHHHASCGPDGGHPVQARPPGPAV